MNLPLAPLVIVALLLSAVVIWLIVRVWRPLRRLADCAGQVAQGDFTALKAPGHEIQEIETLRNAMNAMVGHVRRVQAQEHTYVQALASGQEAERARIARELHDDTTQSLIAIMQSLDMAAMQLPEGSPAKASLQAARAQAMQTVTGLRGLVSNLRPPALQDLGLLTALQMLAERTEDVAVTVVSTGPARRLDAARELALYRIAQEAVANARRHGGAHHIRISLVFQSKHVRMVVKDDGRGFTPPDQFGTLAETGHYGLIGMRERASHLGGELHIQSGVGEGTTVDVMLPTGDVPQPEGVVRDPVCGAMIEPQQAYGSLEHEGVRYYFCCPVCQGAFKADPDAYLQSERVTT